MVGADGEFDGFLALEAVDAEEVLLAGPERFVVVDCGDDISAIGVVSVGSRILCQFGVDARVDDGKILLYPRENTPRDGARKLRVHHNPIAS